MQTILQTEVFELPPLENKMHVVFNFFPPVMLISLLKDFYSYLIMCILFKELRAEVNLVWTMKKN